jgi:hypothetical protein
MALVIIAAMVLPFLLPDHPSYLPKWLFPAIEGLFLVAVVIADPGRIDRRSTAVRALSVGLVIILVLGAAGVTIHLVYEIVRGGPETNSAGRILLDGAVVWMYTIISFTFVYWEFDNGGPEARLVAPREFPDLAFPQHLSPHLAEPGWRPQFFDYLYLGTTNATAFSPTDVMPLKHWAKLAMGVQSMTSLAILGLVIARAVNILR